MKGAVKHLLTVHRQGSEPNIVIVSTARSGTTWLAELLATQGRFKIVNEPCNLRVPVVRDNLGIDSWHELFLPENKSRIARYLRGFIEGRDTDRRFKRETPFSEFWHPVTDRVLFKILFAGEDDVDWLRTQLGAHLVLLLRHPIPVSLSRTEFPRLTSFLAPPYAANFTPAQLSLAANVIDSGDVFQVAVLDWCLQNVPPLRQVRKEWIVLSYEQLVLEPEKVIEYLAERLALSDPQRILARLYKASASTGKSQADSRQVLLNPEELMKNRQWLVDKWRKRVTAEQEDAAFRILERFDVRYYVRGCSLPAAQFLVEAPSG